MTELCLLVFFDHHSLIQLTFLSPTSLTGSTLVTIRLPSKLKAPVFYLFSLILSRQSLCVYDEPKVEK